MNRSRLVLLIACYGLVISVVNAQVKLKLTNPANAKLQNDPAKDINFTLAFALSKLPTNQTATIVVIDKLDGTARADFDYKLTSPTTFNRTSANFTVPITVLKSAAVKKAKSVNLNILVNTPDTAFTNVVTLQLTSSSPGKVKWGEIEDKFNYDDFRFTLLTGSNFRFFGKPEIKDFAGLLHVFLPNVYGRWGLSTGISNINFASEDTVKLTARANLVNRFLNPNQAFQIGAQYEVFQARRIYTQSNRSWSFFLQPAYRLYGGDKISISAIAHFEYLAQRVNATVSERVEGVDTLAFSANDNRKVFQSTRPPRPDRSDVFPFLNAYLGGGVLINILEKDKMNFHLTTVYGRTTDNFSQRDLVILSKLGGRDLREDELQDSWQDFYFIRAILTEKYTKLNATIGLDLRGNNSYAPQVAAYLGIRLDIEKLFKD